MKLTNSDLLIKAIINKGVKKLFCVPGGGCMIMQDAAIRSKLLKPICFHSEQAAVLAAEFYGRNSHCGIGVAMVTTGPGVTNTVSSVTSAWLDSRPLIIILGQVKTPDLIQNNKKIRAYGVQYVDSKNIFSGISKKFISLRETDNITACVNKAFTLAKSGRPGPVIIEVPLDIQSKIPLKQNKIKAFSKKNYLRENIKKINNKIILKSVLKNFIRSKRPLIILGSGCVIDGVNQQIIRDLLTILKAPIANSWGSLELLEDKNPYYVGAPGTVGKRTANICVKNADFILSIGNRIDLGTTAYSPENFGSQAKYFYVVDIDKNELKNHKKFNRKIINSSAKEFIRNLITISRNNIEKLDKYRGQKKDWINFCQNLKNKFSSQNYTNIIASTATKDNGWSTYKIIEILSELFEEKTNIVTGSSGHSTEVFYSYFRVKYNQRVFHSPGLGSMGFGLGSSIGIALSDSLEQEERVNLIETDGSFNTNPQELGIISKLQLPIDIYILNNNGYLSIRNGQNNSFGGRLSGVDSESGLGCANLKILCEAYDIHYSKVTNREQLIEKVRYNSRNVEKNPTLTEIITTSDEVLLPKCMPQKDEKGNITSMPIEDMTPLLSLDELQEIMKYQNLSPESLKIRNATN